MASSHYGFIVEIVREMVRKADRATAETNKDVTTHRVAHMHTIRLTYV